MGNNVLEIMCMQNFQLNPSLLQSRLLLFACFSHEGCPHISCACCVLVSCTPRYCAHCVLRHAQPNFCGDPPLQEGSLCVQTRGPRMTSSDPVSAAIPVVLVDEIDEDSAYTEANDSLQVLLLHGKRQGTEMDASGSVMACAEAAAQRWMVLVLSTMCSVPRCCPRWQRCRHFESCCPSSKQRMHAPVRMFGSTKKVSKRPHAVALQSGHPQRARGDSTAVGAQRIPLRSPGRRIRLVFTRTDSCVVQFAQYNVARTSGCPVAHGQDTHVELRRRTPGRHGRSWTRCVEPRRYQELGHPCWASGVSVNFRRAAVGRRDAIPSVPDLQCAWQLLLQCAGPRCHHLLRTVPPRVRTG